MKTKQLLLVLCFLGVLGACESARIPYPSKAHVHPYGASMKLVMQQKGDITVELVAVQHDTLVCYSMAKKQSLLVPMSDVKSYQFIFAQNMNTMVLWSALMTSTLAHGFLFMVTAPVALAIGLPIALSAGTLVKGPVNQPPLEELYKYARFPAGMPAGMSIDDIR